MPETMDAILETVMAGLDPAIHEFFASKTWMAGTSPAMTNWGEGRE
jgi:hypothetical protein